LQLIIGFIVIAIIAVVVAIIVLKLKGWKITAEPEFKKKRKPLYKSQFINLSHICSWQKWSPDLIIWMLFICLVGFFKGLNRKTFSNFVEPFERRYFGCLVHFMFELFVAVFQYPFNFQMILDKRNFFIVMANDEIIKLWILVQATFLPASTQNSTNCSEGVPNR
jgi:hypothetical protein